jgi:ABC-2 type transport system permease protein
MNINKIFVIIKRELKEKLFSKAFIISTLLFPIFFIFIGWFQYYLSQENEATQRITIFVENKSIVDSLNKIYAKNKIENLDFIVLPFTSEKETIERNMALLRSNKIDGFFIFKNNSLTTKKIDYYSKNTYDKKLFNKIESIFNNYITSEYLKNKNISKNDIEFLNKRIDFNTFKISTDKGIEKNSNSNLIIAIVMAFLLYFSLLMTGSTTMSSIIEEKANRVVEVILSAVRPIEFMTGKIIGNVITSTLQMIIWLTPIFLVSSNMLIQLPKDWLISIDPLKFIYFIFNFVLGLITFVGLFAAVGSMYDNPQDAQSGVWPITLLIMIPFFIAISMVENPSSPIANITAFTPFTSIIVMPVKMNVTDVPLYQILISIFINLLTAIFIFYLSAKIYKTAIMITGKKPNFKDVIVWLK